MQNATVVYRLYFSINYRLYILSSEHIILYELRNGRRWVYYKRKATRTTKWRKRGNLLFVLLRSLLFCVFNIFVCNASNCILDVISVKYKIIEWSHHRSFCSKRFFFNYSHREKYAEMLDALHSLNFKKKNLINLIGLLLIVRWNSKHLFP